MPGNVPNVTRTTFDFTKKYGPLVIQTGVPVHDADVNEMLDNLWIRGVNVANHTQVGDCRLPHTQLGGTKNATSGMRVIQHATVTTNDFTVTDGWAMVGGVLVPSTPASPPVAFDYDDQIMFTGTVDSVGSGNMVDTEKYWLAEHVLTNCRVKMTSGAESGNTFTITGLVSPTTVSLSGGTGSIAGTDTYEVYPPALTTPSGTDRDDLVYLMVFFDDIATEEDSAIVDPGTTVEGVHKSKIVSVVRVLEGSTTMPSSTEANLISYGIRYLKLGELARLNGNSNVLTAMITNESNIIESLQEFYLYFYNGAIPWDLLPDTDNTYDLGSTSYNWKGLYVDEVYVKDTFEFGVSGRVASSFRPDTDGAYSMGSASQRWGWVYGVYGDFDKLVIGDAGTTEGVEGHFVPITDDTYDLGSLGLQWKDLYVDGVAYIDTLGGTTTRLDCNLDPLLDNDVELGTSIRGMQKVWTHSLRVHTDTVANTITCQQLTVSDSVGDGLQDHLVPYADDTVRLGSSTYAWNAVYGHDMRWSSTGTHSAFDDANDLDLIAAYGPVDGERIEKEKGGVRRLIQQGRAANIPWPMLGEKTEEGVQWLDLDDSVMFIIGAIKELYTKHLEAVKELKETLALQERQLKALTS